jgi:YVTN family beta-propeller protein
MRFTYRAACLITVAITGLAPLATSAAASAASARGMAHRAKGCITVTATIPVGRAPEAVAADPKTNTIYTANETDNAVSVISGRTSTVTATIPVGSVPRGVAVDPKTSTIYVANLDSDTVSVLAA